MAVPFQFDKSWYRGQVTSVEIDDYDVENSNLEIHYVDFGETATFKWKALYSLKEEFTRLPFQAVECRLENVKPRHSNAWNEEAVELFKQLTYCAQWKRVMMKIIDEVIDITPVKVVELVDTSSVNDVNIASELMQQGFAERNNSTT